MKHSALLGTLLLATCVQTTRPAPASASPDTDVAWGGFSIRYDADLSPLSAPIVFAAVGTQQSGTWPPVRLVGRGNATGEWGSTAKIPDRPGGEETSVNLFVHLPCEPYDEAQFRTAASYMQDSADRVILKAQYRFNMRPGSFFLDLKATPNECRVTLYKVGDYQDRSTWHPVHAKPVEFDKYFTCDVSGPVC